MQLKKKKTPLLGYSEKWGSFLFDRATPPSKKGAVCSPLFSHVLF
jgi:hypothetical protein